MFKKKSLLVFLLLFLFLALVHLRSQSSLNPRQPNFLDRFLVGLYLPVQKTAHDFFKGVSLWFDDYLFLADTQKRNRQLAKKLQDKEIEILLLNEEIQKLKNQKTILKQLSSVNLKGIPAVVVSYDPISSVQTLWISAGSDQQVSLDAPVIGQKGLVGRVIHVLQNQAQVLLMIDPHFSVDVVAQRSRIRAIASGMGNRIDLTRYPLMSHLEFNRFVTDIKSGDTLITSGLNGVYPKGLKVGRVVGSLPQDKPFQTARLLSFEDFSQLEEVVVLKK